MSDVALSRQGPRVVVMLVVLMLVLLLAVALRLYVGSASYGWPTDEYIKLRSFRMIIGLIVGVSLAISGLSLQALLRNPLAEPFILGLSTGAAAGMMIQLYMEYNVQHPVIGAAVGAGTAMCIVFVAGRRRGVIDPLGLLLTGVVLSTICGAIIMFFNYLSGPGMSRDIIVRWMMGSLDENTSQSTLWMVGSVTLVGFLLLFFLSRAMDVASTSDSEALSLGVNLSRLRTVLFAVASMLAAGAVVLAGPIAFVGLVCPHLARLALGPRHGPLLIGSALLGAALVITADTASSALHLWLGTGLMPIGVFTAIVGGPAFLWMLRPQLGRG